MNASHLYEIRRDTCAEADAIFAKAEKEKRVLTDAESVELELLSKKVGDIDRDISMAEAHRERQRTMPTAAKDENQDRARRGDPSAKFASLGEMLMAVRRADSRIEGRVDPRLSGLNAAATGMSEGVAEDGGFLVQQDFIADLVQPMYDVGEIMSRVTRQPIGPNSNGLKMNAINETSRANGQRWGGVQAYWLAEAGLKTPSRPRFREINMNLKKIAALVYVTDELAQDAVALDGLIKSAVPTEIMYNCEDTIVNGGGVGQPLGYLNSPATLVIAPVAGQAAGSVVPQNIWSMFYRMPARSRSNAVWIMGNDSEAALMSMQLPGTAGVPVYLPPGGISGAPYGTLLGRPIITSEYAAAIGVPGDVQFVDLSQYMVIDKGGVAADYSMHVRFIYDEGVYRFVYRMDGQPMPNTVMTPKNGGLTQSPFIVLGQR